MRAGCRSRSTPQAGVGRLVLADLAVGPLHGRAPRARGHRPRHRSRAPRRPSGSSAGARGCARSRCAIAAGGARRARRGGAPPPRRPRHHAACTRASTTASCRCARAPPTGSRPRTSRSASTLVTRGHAPARAREPHPRPRPPADARPGARRSHPRRAARRDRRRRASSSGRTRAGCATSRSISSARCCGT